MTFIVTGAGTSLIPLRMTFSMIGKFGITGSFGIVFLYTPEIFPTTLRYVNELDPLDYPHWSHSYHHHSFLDTSNVICANS